jgi:hypothetical protein
MSFFKRGRRSAVRLTIGLGVLAAFPFVGAGVAQAAMAGANPLTTADSAQRPDLRTVHIIPGNQAQFCFNKALANLGPSGATMAPSSFDLGGYRWDTSASAQAVNVDSGNTNCVDATISLSPNGGSGRRLADYTFGSVFDAGVKSNIGGSGSPGNVGDSTANLDSTSHSGTTGHTAGPDLQGVAIDTTNNRIVYQLDQGFDSGTFQGAGGANLANTMRRFGYTDGNGLSHFGDPSLAATKLVFDANAGTVAIPFSAGDRVQDAVRAWILRTANPTPATPVGTPNGRGGMTDNAGNTNSEGTPPQEVSNPLLSVIVPGSGGAASSPNLIAASLVPGSTGTNAIDYTFDTGVNVATGTGNGAPQFTAVASNGQEVLGESAVVLPGGTTIRVTFAPTANIQNFQEMIVAASVYGDGDIAGQGGAVSSSNGAENTPGGLPVGDNAGAFGNGFTNGPDAFSVSFNKSTGEVIIPFDQRVCTINNSGFQLLAASGTSISATPTSTSVETTGFTSRVHVLYGTTDLAPAAAIELRGPPVDSSSSAVKSCFGGGFNGGGTTTNGAGNVRQVVMPTASADAFHDPAAGTLVQHWTKPKVSNRVKRALKRTKRAKHIRRHRHHCAG